MSILIVNPVYFASPRIRRAPSRQLSVRSRIASTSSMSTVNIEMKNCFVGEASILFGSSILRTFGTAHRNSPFAITSVQKYSDLLGNSTSQEWWDSVTNLAESMPFRGMEIVPIGERVQPRAFPDGDAACIYRVDWARCRERSLGR